MRPLRVRITNSVLLNGGDAAIVAAMIDSVRGLVARPIEFTVSDQQSEIARRLFPELRVEPWPWHVFRGRMRATYPFAAGRALAAASLLGRGRARGTRPLLRRDERALLDDYAGSDLVLSKGGTYLVERYGLAPHLFDFRLAVLLQRPLVLAPQSLGPFSRPALRRALRPLLARATTYVRDERSRQHLLAIGVPLASIRSGADVAFAAAQPDTLATARTRTVPDEPSVAVSVRDWPGPWQSRYREAMGAVVTHLVRVHGARVTFLSTCQGVPEYIDDDAIVAAEVIESLPADVAAAVELDAGWHSPSELRERFAGFDLAVATRLHGAILALASGVPVLPVAYEFKTDELFAQLGFADSVLDMETVDPASATAALDRFLERLPQRRGALFDSVEEQRVRALAAMGEIAAQLERV